LTNERACEQFYDAYYRTGEHVGAEQSRLWRVAEQEPSLLRVGRTAVDIGCGDGHLCADLANRGWQTVVGIDVSRSRVVRARQRYPHLRLLDTPIATAQLAPASVDLLVLDNVIEHLPDPLSTVRELGSYIAPGGQFVIITPSMDSGHFRLLGRRWTPELAPHAHIYLFTPASLERLLFEAGLRSVSTGSFHQGGMRVTALAGRLARGDVKGTAWRIMQDAGGIYGRLIGAGPMLYSVATPLRSGAPAVSTADASAGSGSDPSAARILAGQAR
jgi:SAM-dependent methyltransferase